MARNQKRKAQYFTLEKDPDDKKPVLSWSYCTPSDPILYCKSDGTVNFAPDSTPSIFYCTQDGTLHSSPDSSVCDDALEVAVEKPDLEAYATQDRSWWDVEILDSTSRNKYIKVHYAGFPEEDDEWLPVSHLRVRSRPCEYSYTYCDELFPGIDVSVATRHPDADEPSQTMWFDARIFDIERKPHPGSACCCSFWVALYEIPEFLHRRRKLLPASPWAVSLKDMTTMRVARNVYFEDLVAASLSPRKENHIWITDGECWNSALQSAKREDNLHDFAEYLEKTLSPVKDVTYADLFLRSMLDDETEVEDEEGLLPSWNPFEVQLETPPDGDDPFANVWEDMSMALKSVDKNLENDDLESCTIDDPSGCVEHTVTFDQEVGEVCGVCGFVLLSIQDIWVHDNVKRIACESGDEENGSFEYEFGSAWDEELYQSSTNVEEAASEVMFELIPNLAKQMQRHQRQGFLFLWRNLAGLDCNGNSCSLPLKAGGCVLSHAPGTGKTFLIISFLQSYIKKYPECRPVVIAPKIMLLPWEEEFRKWNVDIPIYNFDGDAVRERGKTIFEKHLAAGLVHFDLSLIKNMLQVYREAMLLEWLMSPGVLVISYQTFNLLTLEDTSMVRMRKILLERPSIVILDEGHYARNNLSQIKEQVMAIKTPLRVMLSGTLFQNNFEELFTCLNLVRPGFVKTSGLKFNVHQSDVEAGEAQAQAERKLFIEEIGNKIDRGQVAKCSPESMAEGLRLLRRLTAPFVHHYTGGVLREQLPPLREFVIVLQPRDLQQKMIANVSKRMLEKGNLEREVLLSLVCIHPFLLSKHTVGKALTNLLSPEEMMQAAVEDPAIGVKTQFVMNLLERLFHRHEKEKTLIFCVTLDPLMLLEKMMEVQFGWVRDQEMLHINGKVAADVRQSIIERFNNPRGKARVLLLSTKACGEGVTLTGASRVVFMDVLWNPSVRRQAMHRAFRIGQTKVVHVYNLVVEGSLEEVKYRTMVWKDWKSQTIFHASDEAWDDESVANLGRRSNGFWRLRKQASKDSVLNDLERHDAALVQPAFKHIFRHGGLFDDEDASDPESRGVDARDWLRGIHTTAGDDDPQQGLQQSVETDLGGVSSL